MNPLVIATSNRGKQEEWRRLLAHLPFTLRGAEDVGLIAPEEDGANYLENAAIKAIAGAQATGELAIADDTGIEIDALGGAPGLRTTRWVEERGGWDAALAELVTSAGVDARASLVCAVVVADPRGGLLRGEARIGGRLRWPPTDARGPAAIFAADVGDVMLDGVLAHRRAAFATIEAALRATAPCR